METFGEWGCDHDWSGVFLGWAIGDGVGGFESVEYVFVSSPPLAVGGGGCFVHCGFSVMSLAFITLREMAGIMWLNEAIP